MWSCVKCALDPAKLLIESLKTVHAWPYFVKYLKFKRRFKNSKKERSIEHIKTNHHERKVSMHRSVPHVPLPQDGRHVHVNDTPWANWTRQRQEPIRSESSDDFPLYRETSRASSNRSMQDHGYWTLLHQKIAFIIDAVGFLHVYWTWNEMTHRKNMSHWSISKSNCVL
jgi:hypothetical protein